VLKAHQKFLEHLMLAGDLALVAASWILSYFIRFDVLGPALHHGDVPPLGPYLLLLLPILIVWGVSFRAFDLYRPRRIGSHLSEAADIAKASSMGALVLVAVMTFLFRGYEYSRIGNTRIYYFIGWAVALSYLLFYWYRVYIEDPKYASESPEDLPATAAGD